MFDSDPEGGTFYTIFEGGKDRKDAQQKNSVKIAGGTGKYAGIQGQCDTIKVPDQKALTTVSVTRRVAIRSYPPHNKAACDGGALATRQRIDVSSLDPPTGQGRRAAR